MIVLVIALVANWLHQFKPDEYVQAMFDAEFKAETEDYVSQDIGTKDEVLEWRGEELDEVLDMIAEEYVDWLVDGADAWLDNPVYEQPEDHIVYVTQNDNDVWEISNDSDEILDWLM